MSDSFDNDMFGSDEHFKTDLTPLDLEGLQMLEDPNNVLTDPGTEDQLRLCWVYSVQSHIANTYPTHFYYWCVLYFPTF